MPRPVLLPLLLLTALLALPVRGAEGGGLPAARAQAAEARTGLAALRSRQTALRAELNVLGARIETLKAERRGKLSAGDELETALRRSQELSAELTSLAQEAATAEGASRARALALHAALSEELERLRAAWEAAGEREARTALLARMRTLRTERDTVRAALPEGELPALSARPPSDDPEDLLEQADALRDSRDKVRQRLAALQGHIAELREARDLDRRMSDFLGDEAMFDEQDRRLNLRRDGAQGLRVERTSPGGGGGSAEFAAEDGVSAPVAPSPPAAGAPPGSPAPPPAAPAPVTAEAPSSTSARDLRPQVGSVSAQVLAGGSPADLPLLEQEAARLELLARELEQRAAALEARGRARE